MRTLILVFLTCGLWSRPAPAEDLYVGHPKLLFTAADVAGLRAKVADGGADDATYAAMRTWAQGALAFPTTSLLSYAEGISATGQMALVSQIETNGAAYAAKTRQLVLEVARNRPSTNDEFASGLRLQVMALGYDLAFAGATPAERDEVRHAMRAALDFMPPRFNYYCQAYNPYCGNHGMTVGASMGLAVIALWDDVSPAGQDSLATALAFADPIIQKCLTDILPDDGAYREGVLYAGWILHVTAPYFEARRRFDGTDFAADPRFARLIEWLCYELAPDGGGRTNNLNDSPWSSRPLALHGTVIEWAQTRLGSPLAAYLHDHVLGSFGFDYGPPADRLATVLWWQPIAPLNPAALLPSGRLFPSRGLYYFRNGWKTGASGDEVVFAFSSGKFYGGHAQEDRNQFTLAAYGQRFVVDCGAVGSTATPKQSEAHNLVLVDGIGQHNAGNSIGTDGAIVSSLVSGFADYVRGDARAAYATYSAFNSPGVPFAASDWSWGYDGGNPLERADRTCIVVKDGTAPPWMLVADDMRKDAGSHAWDWLLHTSQVHTIDVASDPAQVTGSQATLDLYFAHPRPADLALSWAPFTHGGTDPPTNRLVAHHNAVEPRFAVALVPRRNGDAAPLYASTSDSVSTELSLDWGSARDVLVFNPHRVRVTHEIDTDGVAALVRRAAGAVRGYLLADGTFMREGGIDLVVLGGVASAALAGDSLELSSDDVPFTAWGPEVVAVRGPSGPRAFVRDGDVVRNPTATDVAALGASLQIEPLRPQPARGGATLRLALNHSARTRVRIVDARGGLVRDLGERTRSAGAVAIPWDGRSASGRPVSPGVYFFVIELAGHSTALKVVLIR